MLGRWSLYQTTFFLISKQKEPMYSNHKTTSKDGSISLEIDHFGRIDNQWMSEAHQLGDNVTVEMFIVTRVDDSKYQSDTFKESNLDLIKTLEEFFKESTLIPFLFKTATLTHKEGISTIGSIMKTFHKNIDGAVSGLSYFLREISDTQDQLAGDSDHSRVIVVIGDPNCETDMAFIDAPLIINKVSLPSEIQLVALKTDIVSSIRRHCISSNIDGLRVELINDLIEIRITVSDDELDEYQININIDYLSKTYCRANILEISRMAALQEISR
ncbi:hypothetical protein ACQKQC_16590 [Vibrio fortis]|uniref:hypothetical protein n=1 Tax=Vibrio fortis TaxID=212667 RepID=UPI0040684539